MCQNDLNISTQTSILSNVTLFSFWSNKISLNVLYFITFQILKMPLMDFLGTFHKSGPSQVTMNFHGLQIFVSPCRVNSLVVYFYSWICQLKEGNIETAVKFFKWVGLHDVLQVYMHLHVHTNKNNNIYIVHFL